jgi:hypothetical protein
VLEEIVRQEAAIGTEQGHGSISAPAI